jgi:phage shock protein PspC (stress-responsive transcriptional regulator)
MQIVIQTRLSGHSTTFLLDEDAYQALQTYFEHARTRLKHDPDCEEILRDLEQSIGEKLSPENRVLSRKEVDLVFEQVGAVDAGNSDAAAAQPGRPRRLCRIEEGKWLFGVCQGLAAYSSIRVDWVRSIFVIASVFSGGIPVLIYLVLMFALPLVRTHDEYSASLHAHSDAM